VGWDRGRRWVGQRRIKSVTRVGFREFCSSMPGAVSLAQQGSAQDGGWQGVVQGPRTKDEGHTAIVPAPYRNPVLSLVGHFTAASDLPRVC